ncbi:MAG: hypothetical protein AB8B84_02940 [Granulosicoccus sp.]
MNIPTDKSELLANDSDASVEHASANDMAPASAASPKYNDPPVELTPVFKDMDASEQEQRRLALRSMLAATEARQQKGKRSRNQAMAAGLRVGVKGGEHAGSHGVITDADYIHSRVLVELDDTPSPVWINFNLVSTL